MAVPSAVLYARTPSNTARPESSEWVSTCVVASRHGTSLPSYQMNPSRSAIDMAKSLDWQKTNFNRTATRAVRRRVWARGDDVEAWCGTSASRGAAQDRACRTILVRCTGHYN